MSNQDKYDNYGKYDDIINLPHHQSATRPHMSIYDRAAQFSPFAALTGYDELVKETARQTDQRIELSEDMKSELDSKLALIQDTISSQPDIEITHFVPDAHKAGGAYITERGTISKIDKYKRIIILQGNKQIPIDDIIDISLNMSLNISNTSLAPDNDQT